MSSFRITYNKASRDSSLYFSELRFCRLKIETFTGLSFCVLKEENSRICDLRDSFVCKI
jgi:hypothetical protein